MSCSPIGHGVACYAHARLFLRRRRYNKFGDAASDDDEVRELFDLIEEQSGRLDILVNNAFGQPGSDELAGKKFWEISSYGYDQMMSVGLRSHYGL
mgnify:CR=1 FL=1